MKFFEVLLILACVAIVLGVIISTIIRKKQGKHSCGYCCDGNCSHCSGCKEENKSTPTAKK